MLDNVVVKYFLEVLGAIDCHELVYKLLNNLLGDFGVVSHSRDIIEKRISVMVRTVNQIEKNKAGHPWESPSHQLDHKLSVKTAYFT